MGALDFHVNPGGDVVAITSIKFAPSPKQSCLELEKRRPEPESLKVFAIASLFCGRCLDVMVRWQYRHVR